MSSTTFPQGYFKVDALDEAAVSFYRDNGFLVLLDAFAPDEVEALKRETVKMCMSPELAQRGGEVPIPASSISEVGEDAFIRQFLCIHFPHKANAPILTVLKHPQIVDVLTRIIGPNVKCMQSMLFIKAAGKPGQAWHQDEYFIPTRDRSLTGAWIAMDDADVDNGCLWVIPGSHKRGVLWPMRRHEDRRFDCSGEAYDSPYRDEDAIPVEVPAGAVVFFNGYLLHRSLPNVKQTGFRRALVNHYMSAESLLPWTHQEGKHMGIQDDRDVVLVAGEDPYAWKGLDDHWRPHVRAAGDGGCGKGDKKPAAQ